MRIGKTHVSNTDSLLATIILTSPDLRASSISATLPAFLLYADDVDFCPTREEAALVICQM